MSMANKLNGIIIKGIGGFYYVKTADALLECRAKGIFRRRGLTPLAGDKVEVEGSEGGYVVSEIKERKNTLLRPPVANVSTLIIVTSTVDPRPNYRVLDEMTAIAVRAGLMPIIAVTKSDIEPDDELCRIYRKSGFETIDVCADAGAVDRLRELVGGGICVFSGNSGVGKSTLINKIDPALELETGITSKKLGRGKHTTRTVELFEFAGGMIADTPGFSSLDFTRGASIPSRELAECFPDISKYTDRCAFDDCAHIKECGCEVLAAVERGDIRKSRHESYADLYARAKEAENTY